MGRHRLELCARGVVLDGGYVPLPPTGLAVLGALAADPGTVVSRQALLEVLPGAGDDEHAVEVAVARLRAALGVADLVQTVVKRGYRLAG